MFYQDRVVAVWEDMGSGGGKGVFGLGLLRSDLDIREELSIRLVVWGYLLRFLANLVNIGGV